MGLHHGAQRRKGPAEPGLGRAEWDVQRLGQGRDGHPHVVVEYEDGAMFHREVSKAALELITVRNEAGLVPDRRRRDRVEFDFHRPAAAAANDVEAGVDGQSVEPGLESIWVAQAREVAPRSDVGVLDGVAGEVLVAKDQAGDRLEPRDRPADEQPEGVVIASACPFDEIPLVHGHPNDATIRLHSRVPASQTAKPFPPGATAAYGSADGVASGCGIRVELHGGEDLPEPLQVVDPVKPDQVATTASLDERQGT